MANNTTIEVELYTFTGAGDTWANVKDHYYTKDEIDTLVADIVVGQVTETDPVYTADKASIALKAEVTAGLATKAAIDHNHNSTYEPKNTNIQTHIADTSNPHQVTAEQVGTYTKSEIDTKVASATIEETDPVYTADKPTLATKTYVDDAVAGVTVGDIVETDPVYTAEKDTLTPKSWIGTLASLLTTAQDSIVNAINELYGNFSNYYTRSQTYNKTEIDSKVAAVVETDPIYTADKDSLATKAELGSYATSETVTAGLAGKSDVGHNHAGTYEPANSNIQAHITDTNNPHSVTKTQLELDNVTNDAQVKRSEMGQASGVATLGTDGKIPSAQLNPIAITSTTVVASEAAQLALTAQEGDIAVRSDLKKSYVHNGGTAGTMADWTELLTPTDTVISVDNQTGAVDLSSTYAPIAKGVTNGDTHNHNGGDGAQIDHVDLANKGTNTHAQIDTHIANTANPHAVTADQVLPAQTGMSGKVLTTNGTTSSWGDASAVADASDTVKGIVELATIAETTTGTDTGRAVTPDGLAGSSFGKRIIQTKVIDDATVLTTGDGKVIVCVPAELNGMNLVDAVAYVTTVSSSGTPTIQIRNVTDGTDMLSTRITVDQGEYTSYTAAAAKVIDATKDDVATGDLIAVDVDVAGTGVKGLGVILVFQTP